MAWDWKGMLKGIDANKIVDVLGDLFDRETDWADVGKLFAGIATDIGAEAFTEQLMTNQAPPDSMVRWAQGTPGGLRNASTKLQALAKANPTEFLEFAMYFCEVRNYKCEERITLLADETIDEWLK